MSLRVLYSSPHPHHRLGTGRSGHTVRASRLLDALEALGVRVTRIEAATHAGSGPAVSAYRGGIKGRVPAPLARGLRDLGRLVHTLRHGRRLGRAARSQRPDVILETQIGFAFSGAIAARMSGRPLVLDDVSPRWEEERVYGAGLPWLARMGHRIVTGAASACVVPTGEIAAALVADGVPAERIHVIPNGVAGVGAAGPAERAAARSALGLPEDAVVVLFVGSFQPFHRAVALVEAFAAHVADIPAARLEMVGDGRELPDCRRAAERAGLGDRCRFRGAVPPDALGRHLAAADIAVLPATNDYGDPMKAHDYRAAGLAVVAPDQPTVRALLTDGLSALLVPRDDGDALGRALRRLATDPAQRRALGAAALDAARTDTWDHRAAELAGVLQAAVRPGGGRPAR